jgi:hypothetical protein
LGITGSTTKSFLIWFGNQLAPMLTVGIEHMTFPAFCLENRDEIMPLIVLRAEGSSIRIPVPRNGAKPTCVDGVHASAKARTRRKHRVLPVIFSTKVRSDG